MDKEVRMGEIEAGEAGDNLFASGIGSCLVITLYEPRQRIGALAHTMLPARRVSAPLSRRGFTGSFKAHDPEPERRVTSHGLRDTRYADAAIDEMLKRIEVRGAKRQNLEAKIIGGANMFSAFKSNIGNDNILYAKEKLKSVGVKLVGECVGGSQGRSVEFSVASGIVTVKTKF